MNKHVLFGENDGVAWDSAFATRFPTFRHKSYAISYNVGRAQTMAQSPTQALTNKILE